MTRKEAPQIEPVRAPQSGPRSGAARFTCVPWQRLTHASHGSRPHRELHRRPQWQGSHASPGPFRHTPHTVRGPIESSTEGPCGRVRLRPHADLSTPLTRCVAPCGSPPKAPAVGLTCVPRQILAHNSHGSWPHRELHRRLKWQGYDRRVRPEAPFFKHLAHNEWPVCPNVPPPLPPLSSSLSSSSSSKMVKHVETPRDCF